MNDLINIIKRPVFLISLFVIVFGLTLYAIYYSVFVFHIKSVDPPNQTLPTSQNGVYIEFSQAIDKAGNSEGNVKVTPDSIYSVEYSDNKLSIVFDLMSIDLHEEITISLDGIKGNNNGSISTTLTFEREFISAKNLSSDELERQISESDSFGTQYELINVLPFMNDKFNIRYEYPDAYDPQMKIIVTNLIVDYENSRMGDESPTYLKNLRTSRTAAIKWLKDNGYNDEDYRLMFQEPQLVKEFGGEYYSDTLNEHDY